MENIKILRFNMQEICKINTTSLRKIELYLETSHLKDLPLNMFKRGVYGNLCRVSGYEEMIYAIAYSGMKTVALTVPF